MQSNPELNRKDYECEQSYLVRLFENKEVYNINSYDIRDLMYKATGKDHDESKWRKDHSQYVKWKEFILKNNLDDEILRKYEEIEYESDKKKIRMQDRTREFNKIKRMEARLDEIKDMILLSAKELNETKPLKVDRKEYINDANKAGVLLLSDWHKGLFTINYWNEFNDDEFNRRIKKLIEKVIEYGKFNNIKELHVFQLGDLIHGTLHRLTRIIDTEDAVRSTMSVAETLSEMMSIFANEFEYIHIYNARGNHERVNPNKANEVTTESFNDFIPWFMKERLGKISSVTIYDNKYDSEIIVADILGNNVFATHGHRDRLNTIIQDLTLMIKIFPDFVFSGHIHKNYENEVHKIDHIVNSSLSGVDDFAKDIRLTSKASQKFMIFDKNGRVCTYNIDLENNR